MKKLVLAVAVILVGTLGVAETRNATGVKTQQETAAELNKGIAMRAAPNTRVPDTECAFTFTSGVNLTSIQYCVTANGNIVQIEIPEGTPLISATSLGEGYGVCDVTSGTAYTDYGGFGDSGNWRPATVLSHDAKSVKIARTTRDGVWKLTQTISLVTVPPSVKIVMALKNNSSVTRDAALLRYADVDADGIVLNNLDATDNSALGWNSISAGGNAFGLELQTLNPVPSDSDFAYAQNTPKPPAPCNPLTNFTPGILTATDGSLVMFYRNTFGSHLTVTNTATYKGW
jgi:hypothetical protein